MNRLLLFIALHAPRTAALGPKPVATALRGHRQTSVRDGPHKAQLDHSAAEPCDDTLIPNPFSKDALMTLYDRDGLLSQYVMFLPDPTLKRWGAYRQGVARFAANCTAVASLRRLLADGLYVNTFGMDFTPVQAKRYGIPTSRGDEIIVDSDVLQVWQAFFNMRVTSFMFHVDLPSYYRPMPIADGLSNEERGLVNSFRRDGFVQIDRWTDFDFEGLQTEKINRFGTMGVPLEMAAYQEFHGYKALKPFLEPGSKLWKLIFGYLGDNVHYNGALTFRLHHTATRKSYPNGPWHHDGCGQRLKVFIYLDDVNESTPATLVVPGTHHMSYFPTTQIGAKDSYNKLNETTVRSLYGRDIQKMHGRAGGGFILDTNSLHATDLEHKIIDRDAIVLEFARKEHMDRVPRGPPGKDDNYMSWFRDGQCPQPGRAGPKFFLSMNGSKTFTTSVDEHSLFEVKLAGLRGKHWMHSLPADVAD